MSICLCIYYLLFTIYTEPAATHHMLIVGYVWHIQIRLRSRNWDGEHKKWTK